MYINSVHEMKKLNLNSILNVQIKKKSIPYQYYI